MTVYNVCGKNFFMDGYLVAGLEFAKKKVKKDFDMIFLVDGEEGAGKSVFAQQCAGYVDPSFNIDRICFTPEQFLDVVSHCDKYQAVVYDEAITGLFSRETMTELNRSIVKVLATIRQKNLFVFIVLPCFFDLDKNIAIWRSKALFHVYLGKDKMQRGRFACFNDIKKKDLYVLGKKMYCYAKPSANYIANFSSAYVVDEEEYRKRKYDAFQKFSQKSTKQMDVMKQRDALICYLYQNYDLTQDKIAEIVSNASKISLSGRQISSIVQNSLVNQGSDG